RFIPEIFAGFSYAIHRMADALAKIESDPDAMRANIDKGKDLVAAEPLYIMLALQGYPNAYDVVRTLSRKSRATGARLIDLAMEQSELAGYLNKLPEDQRHLLEDPSLYIGDAPR